MRGYVNKMDEQRMIKEEEAKRARLRQMQRQMDMDMAKENAAFGGQERPTIPEERMPESLRSPNQNVPQGSPQDSAEYVRSMQQQAPNPAAANPSHEVPPTQQQGFSNMSMSSTTERPTPRRNATQAARERMQANRVNQQQHTVHTAQTESYVEQTTDDAQKASTQNEPVNSTRQTRQNNTTTIIGGESNNDNSNNNNNNANKKGFQLNKKSGWIIIAIIAAIVVGGYILFNNKSGEEEPAANNDPTVDNQDDLQWIDPNDIVLEPTYGPEDIQQLRAAGYTGDEIEQYSAAGVDKEDLLRQAKAQRDAFMKEGDKDLYDVSSDAYKHYINQTWLTLPKREDIQDWKMLGFNYTERKNLDYEKIDVYGNQLFLKIYLDDKDHTSWFYLNVTPTEWNALNDSGNVIVNYTYATHLVGDDVINSVEDKQNIYIIEASIEILEKEVQ